MEGRAAGPVSGIGAVCKDIIFRGSFWGFEGHLLWLSEIYLFLGTYFPWDAFSIYNLASCFLSATASI
jgi:hypothetical protein